MGRHAHAAQTKPENSLIACGIAQKVALRHLFCKCRKELKGEETLIAKHFFGDLRAGVLTVINLSPIDVGYGLMMVSAFGLVYAGQGIAAAFLTILIGNLTMAVTRGSGLLFSGPRPAQTLLVAEMLMHLLASGTDGGVPSYATIFIYVAVCGITAGSLEMIFGLLRAGSIIKHLPIPVLTGYINAVAILMLWPALMMIVGLPRSASFADLSDALSSNLIGPLVLSAVLMAVMALVNRRSKRVHWSLVGLFGGVAIYYLTVNLTNIPLGMNLPKTDSLLPNWDGIKQWNKFDLSLSLSAMVRSVLPYALAIAVLNAIESLLASARFEELSNRRIDANRVLIEQGFANILSGAVGGLPLAPSISRVNIAWELGARHYRALGIAAFSIALIMMVGGAPLSRVPLLVVGALMAFLAWTMLDKWTHGQIRKALVLRSLEPSLRRQVKTNLMVMLMVVTVAISGHLIAAMFTGALLAMFIFVRDYSRSVIGRSFSGQHRHSVVMRSEHDLAYLESVGNRVIVQELNAPIVFGTADRLFDHFQTLDVSIKYLILDFQRVREIDDKGARILVRLANYFVGKGVEMHLACLHPEGPRGSVLKDAGLTNILPLRHWHEDVDTALESVETTMLARANLPEPVRMDLHDLDVMTGLTESELAVLHEHLQAECFAIGQRIFSAGEAGDRFYIVAIGRVEIHIPMNSDGDSKRRLAAFAPGAVFGEMAMFSGEMRSADAVAWSETAVWTLTAESLTRLQVHHPLVAGKLMYNIIRQLSSRLALTNDELVYATRS